MALLLTAIAIFLAVYGGLIISYIFADYKDSADSVYLTIGGLSLALAALFAVAALLTASGTRRRQGWLVLAVLAFLASAVPYAGLIGPVGYAVNGALALLAASSAIAYLWRPGPRDASRIS